MSFIKIGNIWSLENPKLVLSVPFVCSIITLNMLDKFKLHTATRYLYACRIVDNEQKEKKAKESIQGNYIQIGIIGVM